jgi:hypothetical protein
MGAPRTAPPGLDYVPIPGSDPNLIFGVVRASLGGNQTTAAEAVFRRLFPVAKPADINEPWPKPTCFRPDVLLPPWACADYYDPQNLCRTYAAQGWDGVKDLVIILSFRFPETVSSPPTMSLQTAFESVRGFVLEKLTIKRNLPTVLAMHLPNRAGKNTLPPHLHAMALARELGPAGFGPFTSLATDAGREVIEAEWAEWRGATADATKKRSK